MELSRWQRAAIGLLLVLPIVGCGGGGGNPVVPSPTGNTTVRGAVNLPPGQSPQSVVVRVEGTSLEARPAADGSYEIRGVPAGSHTISAVAAGTNLGAHVPLSVPSSGEVRATDLDLRPGGQIAGIVTAYSAQGAQEVRAGAVITARPVTDFPVLPDGSVVRPNGGTQLADVDPAVRLTATSAADGTYAIKGAPVGAYWLSATLQGFAAQELMVYVSVASTSPGDFVFGTPVEPGTGTVTGRVTAKGAGGAAVAIAGAQVWADVPYYWIQGGGGAEGTAPPGAGSTMPAIYPRDGGMPPYWGYTTTANDGTYTLSLPRGETTIHCSHRDYMPATSTINLGASATVNFTLEPGPAVPPALALVAAVGKASYTWGEPVAMSMVLKNTGTVPVTLSFTGQEASFAVYRGEEMAWTYGAWPSYPMPMGAARKRGRDVLDAVLQPGGTREYKVSWNQRGYDGVVVEPGTFTLRGSVYTQDVTVEAAPVAFTVVKAQ